METRAQSRSCVSPRAGDEPTAEDEVRRKCVTANTFNNFERLSGETVEYTLYIRDEFFLTLNTSDARTKTEKQVSPSAGAVTLLHRVG